MATVVSLNVGTTMVNTMKEIAKASYTTIIQHTMQLFLNFKNIEEMIREDPNIKVSTIFKAISLMQFEDSVYREI